MNPAETVHTFWTAMEARAWAQVERLMSPNFAAEWPQSGERFNRASFLAVNRHYPGDWHLRVRTIRAHAEHVITEVEVALDGRVDRAISFFEVRDGLIVALREFWPSPMEVPAWRLRLAAEVRP